MPQVSRSGSEPTQLVANPLAQPTSILSVREGAVPRSVAVAVVGGHRPKVPEGPSEEEKVP